MTRHEAADKIFELTNLHRKEIDSEVIAKLWAIAADLRREEPRARGGPAKGEKRMKTVALALLLWLAITWIIFDKAEQRGILVPVIIGWAILSVALVCLGEKPC